MVTAKLKEGNVDGGPGSKITKAQVTEIIETFMETLKELIVDGVRVSWVGFGTFTTRWQEAR